MHCTVLLRKNGCMSSVRHIVVARAASSVRFAPEEALTFNDVPAGNLRAALIVRTRYSLEGFTKAVPRELWIEASSEMSSLDQAIVDLTNASTMVLPALAFCANAPIEEPEPEMAYELRVGENEHKLYQRQVFQEFGFPRARRRAPTAAITPFVQNWLSHPDAERIYRALVQYALALRHGAAGREVLAHAHFYMAVEALTKALLRDERRRTGKSEDELVTEWGIEKKELDGEVRLRRIFGGDRDAYRDAKKASDGLEHGFANYVDIRAQAEAVARKTAAGVRRAIFELIALPPQARALLLADPYREPIDPRPIEQVLRGNLVGPVDGLTHKTQMYPCVRWSFGMADYLGEDGEGRMQFKPKDTVFTPLIGPLAGFQLTSFEVRRPDPHGGATPVAGAATVRMPDEVLQDIRRQVDDVRAGLPVLAQAMAGEQMRTMLSTLGKRTKKLTKRDIAALQRKLAQAGKTILPYHLGLAALSGQVPLNIARYILLERAMAETMAMGGMPGARRKDAFDLLLSKGAGALREGKILTGQDAYPGVAALRDRLVAHLAQPENEASLKPVLDHWYESEDCRAIMRYAAQYKERAARFLSKRPARYTQASVLRLCDQYGHHAGLVQQQLRLLLALDHSTHDEPLLHSDVQEKNLDSLVGSGKTSEILRDVSQALDRRIRNALAHGVPAIDLDQRRCTFRDRDKPVDLSFDELFDQTMRLTVTALCLLSIDQRVQQQWMRQRLDALLRG